MKFVGLLFLILSTFILNACEPSESHHLHNEERPTTPAPVSSVTPAGVKLSPEEIARETARSQRELQIRQELFDFMKTIEPMTMEPLKIPTYSDKEPLEYFVGTRCSSTIDKMKKAAKSSSNLFDSLEADLHTILNKDMASAACDNSSSYVNLKVIPGKLISRHYFEGHIMDPDDQEEVDIVFRPDFTVNAYRVSAGPLDKNKTAIAFVENGAVVTHSTESEYHDILTNLNSFSEHITVKAINGTYEFKQDDNPNSREAYVSMGEGVGTKKELHMTRFEGALDLLANEFVPAQRDREPHAASDTGARCSIATKKIDDDSSLFLVEAQSQCFPESRY